MKYIFGNWKQHGDLALLKKIIECCAQNKEVAWIERERQSRVIGLFPPFVYLQAAHQLLVQTKIQLGAQNVSAEESGAFTGEVSASMLKEVGCSMVLVGHSERRQFFHETDEVVAQKFSQVLKVGLTPILCVGETLLQFEAGEREAVIERQLSALPLTRASRDLSHKGRGDLGIFPAPWMIAYEPVWAIGTGKTATPEQAQKMHQFIREQLAEKFSKDFAQNIPILYGGSVKADNAQALLSMPDINGVLVGGASLDPAQFSYIMSA